MKIKLWFEVRTNKESSEQFLRGNGGECDGVEARKKLLKVSTSFQIV